MRRILIVCVGLILVGCGGSNVTTVSTTSPTVAVAIVQPTATMPLPTSPPKTPLPTQTVAPEITAAPVELDVPALSELNAPPTAAPAPTYDLAANQPVRLVIDAIGLDAVPVSVGLDSENVPIVPKHDVGWYNLGAEPGQGENVVFWGHVLRWKDSPKIPAPFANVRNAAIGASLVIYTANGTEHRYVITDHVWVTPDQVQYILPVGSERVTLVSCIGDKVIVDGGIEMTHRLITIAKPAE